MKTWHPIPAALYSFVEQTPGTLLLENSRPGTSSFSRVFTDPVRVLEVRMLADIGDLFPQIEEAVRLGYFVAGFFAYECGAFFEPSAALRRCRDRTARMVRHLRALLLLRSHNGRVPRWRTNGPSCRAWAFECCTPVVSLGLDEQRFTARIEQIHEWIRAGDVYQLNFTFPVHVKTEEGPAPLYSRLRAAQPVDYGAFLHYRKGRHVLSLSPELFFRVQQEGGRRLITTQPMKGTAPRSNHERRSRDRRAARRRPKESRRECDDRRSHSK